MSQTGQLCLKCNVTEDWEREALPIPSMGSLAFGALILILASYILNSSLTSASKLIMIFILAVFFGGISMYEVEILSKELEE